MSRRTTKYLTAGALVLSAIGYLAYAGMKEGWVSYHMPVDQFLNSPQYQSQRVRLAGKVADEGVVTGQGKLGAEFPLLGETGRIQVVYKGIVPDMFKPGCEVVVEGRLLRPGVFGAETMMTKCASKYDSAGHQKAEKSS